jgi:hypothetical protein
MSGAFAKKLGVAIGTAALTATLVGVGMATVSGAGTTTPPVVSASVSNPVGTYKHFYVGAKNVGSLTLNADNTLSLSGVGGGHWTASGKSVALEFDIGGVFVAKVTLTGLNSATYPGTGFEWTLSPTRVTWYATFS